MSAFEEYLDRWGENLAASSFERQFLNALRFPSSGGPSFREKEIINEGSVDLPAPSLLSERSQGRLRALEVQQNGATRRVGVDLDSHDLDKKKNRTGPDTFLEWVRQLRRPHEGPAERSAPAGIIAILEDLGYDPTLHNRGVARPPLTQNPRYHCVLSYNQFHDAKLSYPSESAEFYRLKGSAYRTISFGQDDEPDSDGPDDHGATDTGRPRSRTKKGVPQAAVSQQLISYWGLELGPGLPWAAVLLVDPPLYNDPSRAIYFEQSEEDIRLRTWTRYEPAGAPIPPLPPIALQPPIEGYLFEGVPSMNWPTAELKMLDGCSMLDNLTKVILGDPSWDPDLGRTRGTIERRTKTMSWDPNFSEVAGLCCRVIMAKTSVEMQKMFGDAYRLKLASALELDLRDIAAFNFKDFDRRAWNLEWEGRRFTRLWKKREELELMRFKLKLNIGTVQTLFSEDTDLGRRSRERLATDDKVEESGKNAPLRRLEQQQVRSQMKLDLAEWENLELMADYADEMIKRITESYLQTVAACQASAATAQANFVGQITKMASVFVPVSLIAAIFSMGGNFAAGSSMFWIFWAISMPIAALLMAWMFGKDIWKISKEYVTETVGSYRKWVIEKLPGRKLVVETKKVPFGMA
ncbi:hypothetical protein QBC34DRAFT_436010 [Podospora aff. communis PSN243]|uniref:Uncharacterized protein n=1 Tax=Podospora aff. communis PSN243 TaxID=3040156 RepID=A0AAV9GWC5_9PEZI|nr:hypothetical protein QBC34DRAFT_436010 [Podospora aff. communis PSN243]